MGFPHALIGWQQPWTGLCHAQLTSMAAVQAVPTACVQHPASRYQAATQLQKQESLTGSPSQSSASDPKCATFARADQRARGLQVLSPFLEASRPAQHHPSGCRAAPQLPSSYQAAWAVATQHLCGCRCAAQEGSRAPSMQSWRQPSRRQRPLAWESGARSGRHHAPHDAADMHGI